MSSGWQIWRFWRRRSAAALGSLAVAALVATAVVAAMALAPVAEGAPGQAADGDPSTQQTPADGPKADGPTAAASDRTSGDSPEPASGDEAAATAGQAAASEGVVQFAFSDAEVRDIFASLADAAGWSFVALPDLTGTATLAIKELTVEQAVDMVAKATGLAYVLEANTLVVGTRASLQARFDPELVRPRLPALVQGPAPGTAAPTGEGSGGAVGGPGAAPAAMTIHFLRLDYVEAAAMKDLATMVVPEENLRVDEANNLLVVRATPEQIDAVLQLAANYDLPPAQVLIEARVEEVLGNATDDLGIAWQVPGAAVSLEPRFGSVILDPAELLATLHALEERDQSKLLARPQVTTISGQTARIFIGDEMPVILKGQGDAQDTIQTITAGVLLEITPLVGSDGTITAEVSPEVSTIAGFRVAGDQQLPQIRTRRAQTRVRVKDGQPIVIGGLINQLDSETVSGLPVLKEFPLIGGLFSAQRTDQQQSEMLIFLIPRVLPAERGLGAGLQPGAGGEPEPGAKPGLGPDMAGSGEAGGTAAPAPGTATARVSASSLLGRAPHWTLRLDAVDAPYSAWELTVERPVTASQGAATSLLRTPVSDGATTAQAWGLGLEWRWYAPSSDGGGWLGVKGEAFWPDAPVGAAGPGSPLTVVSVSAGARTSIERVPVFLEPYIRWVPAVWGAAAQLSLPRRTPGLWLGLKLGWAF